MPATVSHTTRTFPFGEEMAAQHAGGAYSTRYKFNGKELDPQTGYYYYGARYYDPVISRWLSVDPLAEKYTGLSPYNYTANNPVMLVDPDGRDFGILIDPFSHTITIIANVYTTDEKAYNQAVKAAQEWNSKVSEIGGYSVSFKINVVEPPKVSEKEVVSFYSTQNFYRKNGKLKKHKFHKYAKKLRKKKALDAAMNDPIGNSYAGNNGHRSKRVSGKIFIGGQTINGKYICMNTHAELGDMGEYNKLVAHEMGHMFGLDDADANRDGINDKYYPGDEGIMQYSWPMHSISNNDINMILQYANDYLEGKTDGSGAKVSFFVNWRFP